MRIPPLLRQGRRHPRGITLLEMSVVLLVLLALTTILAIGVHSWKRGSDRASCILSIRNVQTAVRSYQNFYGYVPGNRPAGTSGGWDIADQLRQKEFITEAVYQTVTGNRECPGGGKYRVPSKHVFPEPGELFVTCSLQGSNGHAPENRGDW